MANIRIPEQVVKGFELVSKLNDDQRLEILNILGRIQIGTTNKVLVDNFIEKLSMSKYDSREIVSMILSILGLIENSENEVDVIADDLFKALGEIGNENITLDSEYKTFLNELLKKSLNSPLSVTQKAFRLIHERDNLLIKSKIITDVRPVFGGNNNSEVKATSILFNLRLSYTPSQNSESESTITFALDEKDLLELKDEILRAEVKAKSIKESFTEFTMIQTG